MEVRHQKITMRVFAEPHHQKLKDFLLEIETVIRMELFGETLYTLLIELIDNAVKANIKRVFFRNSGYSLNDPEGYQEGMKDFIKNYSSISSNSDYWRLLEEQDLSIDVDIHLNPERLLIFVENNVCLLQKEEEMIRRKMEQAMSVKNIVEFTSQFKNDAEIKGLGLAMVVLLLKNMGFNPNFFRVYVHEEKTIARLELPLEENYNPIRNSNLQAS